MRVLIDTNVIVDVLQQRAPWNEAGNRLFLAIACGNVRGCLTAKEIADIHYFSRKQFRGSENIDEQARSVVAKLMSLFEILDTSSEDCKKALAIKNKDYEDAIMISMAEREQIDCIITRNLDHFAETRIPIFSPDGFLKEYINSD